MTHLLLIRHAERPKIPPHTLGSNVLLSLKGEKDSIAFAQKLSDIVSLKSSPIKRCLQTARHIASTVHYPRDKILTCTDLGDPGFMIDNDKLAWQHWQEKDHDTVNQYLLNGKDNWTGFKKLNDAVQTFRKKILLELLNKPGLHVWVTHDTVLATFASRVLKKSMTLDQWPHFLGYLKISLHPNYKLFFNYKQCNHPVG